MLSDCMILLEQLPLLAPWSAYMLDLFLLLAYCYMHNSFWLENITKWYVFSQVQNYIGSGFSFPPWFRFEKMVYFSPPKGTKFACSIWSNGKNLWHDFSPLLLLICSISYNLRCPRFTVSSYKIWGLTQGSRRLRHWQCPHRSYSCGVWTQQWHTSKVPNCHYSSCYNLLLCAYT
jgi:hypothetical protein